MIIHKSIRYDQKLKYIEVPFSVNENIEKITVSYVVKDQQSVIDIGIRDPLRVRGWSGGARDSFYLSTQDATPGYLSGDFPFGEWAIILGAYKVPETGCQVEIKLELKQRKEKSWLKGDLHLHSVHSDGSYTMNEIVAIAEELELDFIATTDHNTISQNFDETPTKKLTRIPGMELTTYYGHCNLFGVKDPIKDFRSSSVEELTCRIHEAKSHGAKISINHPHDPGCLWEWGWNVVEYDWVEIWNGPWREGNQKTLEWWQQQLIKGEKIVVVGGSDTHRPNKWVKHGMPTTWVLSSSVHQEAILSGIDKGNVFISYSPKGPRIKLDCGTATMGDTVNESSELVELVVTELTDGDIVKVISEKGVEVSFTKKESQSSLQHNWLFERRFYRIEVWRYFYEIGEHALAAISNPIYKEKGN